MYNSIKLSCPECNSYLTLTEAKTKYVCSNGCEYPIANGIPRFVTRENYASSFGLQWNLFRRTQLDSFTGTSISRDRLKGLVGGSLDIFRGKTVLEAGCGAGRFTEVMLAAGANVFAVDISTAVEANYLTCCNYQDYFVCQADILNLPIQPEQFDIVVCAGVIQHTPSPEETISRLCAHVKPGGLLVIDHYTYTYPITRSRRTLRSILLKRSSIFSMKFCKLLVAGLWPVHILIYALRFLPKMTSIRHAFLRLSPVVDYQGDHPQLGKRLLYQWALLDTHDTLTDYYKHIRTVSQIYDDLCESKMVDIDAVYGGNGVEAMARKPSPRESRDLGVSTSGNYQDQHTGIGWPTQHLKGPFKHIRGYAWLAELGQYRQVADCPENPLQSVVFLYENGVNVGPGHSSHLDIIARGQGRYSHWGDGIIFSTSDHSDPNTNGRTYSIRLRYKPLPLQGRRETL